MTETTDELLDRFFAAIVAGDLDTVADCYAEDVEVWHNVTRTALDKAGSVGLLRYWTSEVADRSYEIKERSTFDGGAVQRHVVHGDAHGTALDAEVCIVFHVTDGRITKIFEYLDPAAVAAVFPTA